MSKEVDKLEDKHNRDVGKLEQALEKKVDKTVFQAVVDPIKKNNGLLMGAVFTVAIALVLTALSA